MDLCEYRPDRRRNGKFRPDLPCRRTLIDHRQMLPAEIIYESRRRIDHQRRTPDDQGIRPADRPDAVLDHIRIKPFFIEHHVRLDAAAAAALWNPVRALHIRRVVELAALLAVIAVNASMQLQHVPAAGRLMKPVDILGDHRS